VYFASSMSAPLSRNMWATCVLVFFEIYAIWKWWQIRRSLRD